MLLAVIRRICRRGILRTGKAMGREEAVGRGSVPGAGVDAW